jgi:hypothetical protein
MILQPWAGLAKEVGMGYAVLTTRRHGGHEKYGAPLPDYVRRTHPHPMN